VRAMILLATACVTTGGPKGGGSDSATHPTGSEPTHATVTSEPTTPTTPPGATTPSGCARGPELAAADVSAPDRVIGDGTPASCTSAEVAAAVAAGGVITFDCGPDPVTIELDETLRVYNDAAPEVVLDGGGLVTLSGRGERRILYLNTCDPELVWTTPHCDDQDHPRLTVQNLRFVDGDSSGDLEHDGGGAIWARGGRLKIVSSVFQRNTCAAEGPDVGGAAVRAFDQSQDLPAIVVDSTFGGDDPADGNTCSNGGGLSSIGVSWTIVDSVFRNNHAIGVGGNPAQPGTPGGGSGGAIYNDGNAMTLSLCGTVIEDNDVVQHGSAIFFVSNDHSGDVVIDRSTIVGNTGGSWYPVWPQISAHDDTPIVVTDSTIEETR
jgi:hypothetical protein